MDSIVQQLRIVARKLARAPLFTAATVGTLALGIGANTAIFSVVNGVLLEPLPFEDAGELVGVWHTAPGLDFPEVNMSPASYFTYKEQGRVFDGIGLWDNRTVTVTGLEEPRQIPAMLVTHDLLPTLRVEPRIGRRFTEEDAIPDAPLTAMLSHGYWVRSFGEDPDVLGRTITVNGLACEIIGVLGEEFTLPRISPDIYLPLQFDRTEVFLGNFDYQGIARLADGVTVERANADVDRMIPMSAEEFPGGISVQMLEEAGFAAIVRPLKRDYVGDVGSVLWVLLGTVGMVLLIACANVANLFLVRAEGRQREVAVRTAIGASRRRIAGQFLVESVVLGLTGGLAGLALAFVGLRSLLALAPESLPRMEQIAIDPGVLLFTLLVSVLAGLSFGIFPVLRLRRLDMVTSLKEGGRGGGDGRERHRTRNVLVAGQVALALVLLVGSGLMIRSFQALRDVHPGFERPEEVMTFRVSIPVAEIEDPVEVALAYEQIQRNIDALPGVTSVGASFSITMDRFDSNDAVWMEDFPTPDGQIPPIRRMKWVTPGYFETMENPPVAGRTTEWADLHDRSNKVVITENFAREYWDDPAEAVGRRIGLGAPDQNLTWFEIMGVVGDVQDNGLDQEATTVAYFPLIVADLWGADVFVRRTMAYAIRTSRPNPASILPEAREAVWSVNPNLPLASARTLDEILEDSLARTSFTLMMLAIAATVALLLGAVGIYGVVSYVVSQRTREIGVRMALGAERSSVSHMVLKQGIAVAGAGVGIGLIASLGLTRLMSSLLYGVAPTDPVTYGAVAGALTLVALLASYLPALRASSIDPAVALRSE